MKKNKVLIVLLLLCLVILSSCVSKTVPENPQEPIAGYNIDNFQVVYKNQYNEQGQLIENFAVNVWNKLVETYGYSNQITEDSSPLSNLGYDFDYVQAIYLIDTIRGYAFYSENKLYFSTDGAWNWTFNTTNSSSTDKPLLLNDLYFGIDISSYNNEQTLWSEIYSVYKTNTNIKYEEHYNAFKSSEDISKALKIVIYEIALNKEPTIFNAQQTDSLGTIKLATNNGKNLDTYLSELQQEYRTTCSYIGLTEDCIEQFKQYILNNIIGTNAIEIQDKNSITINNSNYTNVEQVVDTKKDYNNIIDLIIQSEYENNLEPCINSTLAVGTSAQKTDFLMTAENTFSNITARPYQSIIINPDKDGYFSAFTYSLYCEKSVTMDMKITYNNLKENTSQTQTYTYNLHKDTVLSDNFYIYQAKPVKQVSQIKSAFDSSIFAQSTTINNLLKDNLHKLSEYYPIVTLPNNLITTSINASLLTTEYCETGFYEISFLPSEYVDFKFGIMAYIITD